jgi:hypothetical protein
MIDSPPNAPTLFIDRNSGGRTFRDLLNKEGLNVVLHDEIFKQTAADEEWLVEAGRRGLVIVTGDMATTRSPLFLEALNKSRAAVFILKGLNGASAEGKAKCILQTFAKMQELMCKTQLPAVWRINRDGMACRFDFKEVLFRMRKRSAR